MTSQLIYFQKKFSINSRHFSQTSRSDTILILEPQKGYHLDIFCPKQESFQNTCIKHLQYSRKALFLYILVRFSMLNDFKINFFSKEVALDIFSFGFNSPSPPIPPIPRFRFGSIAQNENAESAKNFRFSISSRDFCQI